MLLLTIMFKTHTFYMELKTRARERFILIHRYYNYYNESCPKGSGVHVYGGVLGTGGGGAGKPSVAEEGEKGRDRPFLRKTYHLQPQ